MLAAIKQWLRGKPRHVVVSKAERASDAGLQLIEHYEGRRIEPSSYLSFRARVAAQLPIHTPEHIVAAFTSFAHSEGFNVFLASVSLRAYRYGDVPKAAASLAWWDKRAGEIEKSLQRRRCAEALIMLGTDVQEAIQQASQKFP